MAAVSGARRTDALPRARGSLLPWGVLVACLLAVVSSARPAHADDAQVHFRRGVDVYLETNYPAALVEFKRAYEILPNTNLLFNIGQTEYQLQLYADALAAFEQYLREGGSPHKAEVESAISVLRTRVGHVRVITSVPGAEVAIDDRSVGATPLAEATTVSIGRRKVTVSAPGRETVTRWVEVASGDDLRVNVELERKVEAPPPALAVTPPRGRAADAGHRTSIPVLPWVATGVLGAGAVITGVFAIVNANALTTAKSTFPANPAEVSWRASRTTVLAATADGLGAASVLLGALSLYLTLSRAESRSAVQVVVSPGSLGLRGAF